MAPVLVIIVKSQITVTVPVIPTIYSRSAFVRLTPVISQHNSFPSKLKTAHLALCLQPPTNMFSPVIAGSF